MSNGEYIKLKVKGESPQTYDFREVKLDIDENTEFDISDAFVGYEDTTLEKINGRTEKFHGKYTKTIQNFKRKHKDLYYKYKSWPIGKFLDDIKKNKEINNQVYKKFLKNHGDEKYCQFGINDESEIDGKKIKTLQGLYCFSINRKDITYIGSVAGETTTYGTCINNDHGKIEAEDCYLHGHSTDCRINSKINECSKDNPGVVSFWVYPMECSKEINKLKRQLLPNYENEKYYWGV